MSAIEFNVPTLGERGDLTDRELPPQAMRLCQNMWRTESGDLEVRPGYKQLSATQPVDRVMGLHYFKTAAGANKFIAATLTAVWAYNYSSKIWEDISGTALSGANTNHVRCATFNAGGTFKVIITNGANGPKIWNGSAGTYSTLGGSPTGTPLDVKVCANRAAFLRTPFNVQISEFNDPETFPSGNGFNFALVDSGDFGVGMERFNRTSIAIFGEESQWIMRAQSGSIPFRVERISECPGPLSAACLVFWNSAVYYLARDYNVYRFDGVQCLPIGGAMKPYVRATIDEGFQVMSHGVYHDRHGKIVWLFPPSGTSSPSTGIYLDVKTGEMGRILYGVGITASARVYIPTGVTWGDLSTYTWDGLSFNSAYPSWDSFGTLNARREVALGNYIGTVSISGSGDGSDDNAAIDTIFECPLHSYGGWDKNYVPSTAETFFGQTSNSTTVNISAGYTDTLMTDPSYQFLETVDLSTDQRNDIDLTELGEKRFLSIKHQAIITKGQYAWKGMLLHGESAGVAKGPVNE